MFQDFMDISTLTTFAGLTGAVIIIVQFTKSIIKKKFGSSFVRLYSFIVALILTFVFAKNGNEAQDIIITLINSMLITITSMGGYEAIADPMAQSVRKDR